MKILIPHRQIGYFYGGAENHIKEITKRLAKKGNKIILLTERGKEDPLTEIKKLENIDVVYISSAGAHQSANFNRVSGKVSGKIKELKLLTKYLRILSNFGWLIKSSIWIFRNRKKFDLIWSSKNIDTVSLKFLNKFVKVPYVVSLEGYDFIEAENTKKCPHVFTIAPFICKTCEEKHNFKPHYITIGIDGEDFKIRDEQVEAIKKKYCPNKELIVLNVGRLIGIKDMPNFIHAAARANKEYPAAKFIICGNGPEKENLKKIIKKLNLEKIVFIVENLSNKEIFDYYNAADIFVHVPKQGNHFGVVFLEAMAAGLPIIAANEDATPDTVDDAALLVPIENEKILSKNILKLLRNKSLRERLSHNSKKRVESEFNWDKIIPKIETLFKEAARKNKN